MDGPTSLSVIKKSSFNLCWKLKKKNEEVPNPLGAIYEEEEKRVVSLN